MRLKLTTEILTLGVIVYILNLISLKFYLYWSTDYMDIIMHTLGGILIGLIAISFLSRFSFFVRDGEFSKIDLYMVLVSVLLVGVSWELWEVFVKFTDIFDGVSDTILDLIMDTVGGILSYIYYLKYKKIWHKK